MKPIDVQTLYRACERLIKEGKGDYSVFLADDEEGNGYHGCWYCPTAIDTVDKSQRQFFEEINHDICCLDNKDKAIYLG